MSEIDWRAWALRTIRELNRVASDMGADYVGVDCPRCGRRRMEVDRVERGDETGNPPECEKCGWSPGLHVACAAGHW